MRLLLKSPTYKLSVTGSTDTPTGPLNIAAVPCPSDHPATPLPASVLTFQKQGGCALSPLTVQAVAGEQVAHDEGARAKVPIGQEAAANAHSGAP